MSRVFDHNTKIKLDFFLASFFRSQTMIVDGRQMPRTAHFRYGADVNFCQFVYRIWCVVEEIVRN